MIDPKTIEAIFNAIARRDTTLLENTLNNLDTLPSDRNERGHTIIQATEDHGNYRMSRDEKPMMLALQRIILLKACCVTLENQQQLLPEGLLNYVLDKQPGCFKEILQELKKNNQQKILHDMLEAKNSSECSPLITAVKTNNIIAVRALIDAGVDINAVDDNKDSALYWAINTANQSIFELLLEQPDISITLKNKDNKTAHQLAHQLYTRSEPQMMTSPAYVPPGSSPRRYKAANYEQNQRQQTAAQYFMEQLNNFSNNLVIQQTTLPLTDPNRTSFANAAHQHPDLFFGLLKALQKQYPEGIPQEILQETAGKTQLTPLLLALKVYPYAVQPLLVDIAKLEDKQEQKKCLLQTDDEGNTALMLATLHRDPKYENYILDALTQLHDKSAINTYLSHTNHAGKNALILLASQKGKNAEETCARLLSLGNEDTIKTCLLQRDNDDNNALVLFALNHPVLIPKLIQIIVTLPLDVQGEIYNQLSNESNRLIKPSTSDENNIFRLNAAIDQNFKRLRSTTLCDSTKRENLGPVVTLKTSIDEIIQTYMASSRTQLDYEDFIQDSYHAIKKFRQNKDVSFQPDTTPQYIAKIIITLAIAVTFVGLFYLAFKAGENHARGRSMVIQTESEILINGLEDIIKTFPQTDEPDAIQEAVPIEEEDITKDGTMMKEPSAPPPAMSPQEYKIALQKEKETNTSSKNNKPFKQ
jgi:ankyrin repeat protein